MTIEQSIPSPLANPQVIRRVNEFASRITHSLEHHWPGFVAWGLLLQRVPDVMSGDDHVLTRAGRRIPDHRLTSLMVAHGEGRASMVDIHDEQAAWMVAGIYDGVLGNADQTALHRQFVVRATRLGSRTEAGVTLTSGQRPGFRVEHQLDADLSAMPPTSDEASWGRFVARLLFLPMHQHPHA